MPILNHERKIGQFFTPDFIVNFMLSRTLCLFLAELKQRIATNSSQENVNSIHECISHYKMLDPCLGQGIFVELALKELIKFYDFFNNAQDFVHVENPASFALKNNLYGVEFDLNALKLAKKRLLKYLNTKNNKTESLVNIKHGNSLKIH